MVEVIKLIRTPRIPEDPATVYLHLVAWLLSQNYAIGIGIIINGSILKIPDAKMWSSNLTNITQLKIHTYWFVFCSASLVIPYLDCHKLCVILDYNFLVDFHYLLFEWYYSLILNWLNQNLSGLLIIPINCLDTVWIFEERCESG